MVYRTVIFVLLVGVVGAALGCSLFTHQEEQAESDPASTGSTSAPVPAGTGNTSAPPLYFGDTSIEERISTSAAVVKGRLARTTTEVVTTTAAGWDEDYYVVSRFNLSVVEYLIGSGSNSIIAIWVSLERFDSSGSTCLY